MPNLKNVRILVAGVKLPPETFLGHLFRGLEERGADLTVASNDSGEKHWHRIPTAHLRGTSSWGWNMMTGRKKWDIVYFPWNSSAVELRRAFEMGRSSVISCRGAQVNIAPHNPRRSAFVGEMRSTMADATLIHCVSEEIRKKAVSLGAPEERCRVIHPAVDHQFFHPSQIAHPEDVFRIAMIGGPIWRKGYEYALIGFAGLVASGVKAHLNIIGIGNEMQRVQYTISDLGLKDQVTLQGKADPIAIRDTLHRSTMLMLASVSEGISNGVLEAMACGLPVVTANCGGMTEAVRHRVEGLVVPIRDPHSIAEALCWLASHASERSQMGNAARHRVLEKFTLVKQLDKWEVVMREAMMLSGYHA